MSILQAADITYCPKCQSYQNYLTNNSQLAEVCKETSHGECKIILRTVSCANCNTFLYNYYHHTLESLLKLIGRIGI